MLIGELAKRTGLPVHTIRFYEREGLIDERFYTRGDNRYRHYTEAAVERLQMIRHGQAAGYTLSEIGRLLDTWEAGELTPDVQIAYLEAKVDEIVAKMDDLAKIKRYLEGKLTRMRAAAQTGT